MKVKVTKSCLTLYNPMDCIVPEILQARILEWVAFPFSRGSSQPRDIHTTMYKIHSNGDQSWVFFGRNDAKAETPVLWPPHVKS